MYSGLKVLIIEDSVWLIERLLYILEETGHVKDAEYALTYDESLFILEKRVPDVIFLDINMPNVNGIRMLKIFKKRFPFIKIVICTIHTDEYYRNTCKSFGADYFVSKSSAFDLIPLIINEISLKEKETVA